MLRFLDWLSKFLAFYFPWLVLHEPEEALKYGDRDYLLPLYKRNDITETAKAIQHLPRLPGFDFHRNAFEVARHIESEPVLVHGTFVPQEPEPAAFPETNASVPATQAGYPLTHAQQCPPAIPRDVFSTLPSELRVMIYKYCISFREVCIIDRRTWRQPKLLSVCHLVRNEALDLYYRHNRFIINTMHVNLKAYAMFYQHARHYRVNHFSIHGNIRRDSWANMMQACRARHAGRPDLVPSPRYPCNPGMPNEWKIVALLLHTTERNRRVPWPQVRQWLLIAKRRLAALYAAGRITSYWY